MNQNRGQITVFILVGLVMLIAFCLLFAVYKLKISYQQIDDFNNVKIFLDSCISNNIEEAIKESASKGFDLNQEHFVNISTYKITLLKKDNLNLVPTIESIEKQLEDSLENKYSQCIMDSYNKFIGIKIKQKNPVFEISINDNYILAEAKLSTKISRGMASTKYKEFISNKNISLGYIVSLVNASINQMLEKGYDIERMEFVRNNLDINITRYQGISFISLTDTTSNIAGKPLRIVYAVE